MEPLIFALVIMAISAFFSNKKKKEQGSSPGGPADKQQSPTGRSQGGFKRMEDYAKEIYGEFQAQMNTETDKKEQVKEAAREVVGRHSQSRPGREAASAASAAAAQAGGRLSAHQKPSRPAREKRVEQSKSLFPLSQSEAQKGIILAEVFMPPKSKRK
ncbi:MAG TPA: hypothetical protein VK945_07805 [Planococcus sp. (in: firmicutes)]|nr:hypothetical protein [Planococcus sp. (in: firmicutes)]